MMETDKPLTEEQPVTEGTSENTVMESKPAIGGWLAVFLWIGLGAGALLSLFNILANIGMLTPVYVLVMLAIAGSLVTAAVAAIAAFIKRKPNAVALAKTYIAMIAIDAVVCFVNYSVLGDQTAFNPGLRSVMWSGIWFAFLCCSTRVAALIPKETRVWKGFEKLLLCIYLGANVILIGSVVAVVEESLPVGVVYNDAHIVEGGVEELQGELPMDLGDGLLWDKASIDGRDVIFTYRFQDIYKSELTSYELTMFKTETEANLLYEYAEWESDQFMSALFNEGYAMVIRYTDALGLELCAIRLTKEGLMSGDLLSL